MYNIIFRFATLVINITSVSLHFFHRDYIRFWGHCHTRDETFFIYPKQALIPTLPPTPCDIL